MANSDFVHLHLHTQYSLLDGACRIPELVKAAHRAGMRSLAMTDHGNLFGAIEFYRAAEEAGIKPIIGAEVYVAPESRFERSSRGIRDASFHLVLLARDEIGYKNLIKLVSAGYLEGFYYRPRVDKELLARHAAGLTALSACLNGELPHLLLAGQEDGARRLSGELSDIFGKDHFFLEIQNHGLEQQKKLNALMAPFSKKMGIPLVATNDVHYLKHSDAKAHEALLCIQTQTHLEDPQRFRFDSDQFYLKTAQEMQEVFKEFPEAVARTAAIAESCNLELDFKKTYLPHFNPPEGKTREQFLLELCREGARPKFGEQMPPAAEQRLTHELEVIRKAGYTSYFLIAWDFVRHAKKEGISVGPGRGSAAGSLVAYCLGITDIDPLRYDLLFERFLNPDRVSLPDIDIDFDDERRGEVINYVTERYGKENVAQIITFGTMGAKAVVRDVARVMNIPYAEADRIAKLIPNDLNITLEQALVQEPELARLASSDPKIRDLFETSKVLEGLTRHASTHAAGVVISEKPLTEHIPLYKTGDGQMTTGFPMESLEKVGLLKMDFLGLKTLTVIDQALKIIRRTAQASIDIAAIPLNDPKTYQLLCKADSIGVFQLESGGMRELLKKLKPTQFEDLIALLALFRPGPLGSGMVEDFIKRKHGQAAIRYDHPLLEPILHSTYGTIVYQEQVMRIVSSLAGFSLSKADTFRRAISKKTPEVIEQEREAFGHGCAKNGVPRAVAEKIFKQIEYFVGYSFNKSHSAAYALISYRTAYLKANFPVEFMAALLTSERANTDKIAQYIDECRRRGIRVLPPDANESFSQFTVVGTDIRFGLAAVKNVGDGAVEGILKARKLGGSFKSLFDLCERCDTRTVNRKVIESLIKCGACDSLGLHRSQLMALLDEALERGAGTQRDRQTGQLSFFESGSQAAGFRSERAAPNTREWPEFQKLAFEKEMLGFYVTGHPLAQHQKLLQNVATCSTRQIRGRRDGEEVLLGGVISRLKMTTTKKTNERMAVLTLEDLDGELECVVFPQAFARVSGHLKADALILVKGTAALREEKPKVIVTDVLPLEQGARAWAKQLRIRVNAAAATTGALESLKQCLLQYPGKLQVVLLISEPSGRTVEMETDRGFYVEPNPELLLKIAEIVGEEAASLASART